MIPRINFFQQLKSFYEGVWHGDNDFTPSHVALYFFLVNQNNRNEWAEWFKVSIDLGMKGSCIGTKKTYYSALEDLAEWGYIKYEKGANAWKSPKISIIPLHGKGRKLPDMPEVAVLNNTSEYTSMDTASVTASVTATIPQVLPQVSTLQYPNKDYKTDTRPLDLRPDTSEGGAPNRIDWDAIEASVERKTADLKARGLIP